MATQYYADYHLHTECSPDSKELLQKHLESAVARGLSEMCVTDHWDLVDDEPTTDPNIIHWWKKFREPLVPPDFTLRFGVEVGDAYTNPDLAEDVLSCYPFDFVLGSVHALHVNGGTSIYYGFKDCDTQEKLEQFFLDYFDTLIMQSKFQYFDSLGHIIYPFRYLNGESNILITNYMEQITTVLEHLIKNDRCFEVNTTQGTTLDIWKPILTRYKEMGGTLLTIGSDSHRHQHTGLGIVEGVALLKSMGFSSYQVFEQRNRIEIPIL